MGAGDGEHAKHAPKEDSRRVVFSAHVVAAIRLLLFTGCRLREILHLKWRQVDLERGMLDLDGAKEASRKRVVLAAPALEVLAGLKRVGEYVIAGDDPKKPRADLKRPWDRIARHAGLDGVRLHDLRHTFASAGAGKQMGLPIIGELLGHRSVETKKSTRISRMNRSGQPSTGSRVSLQRSSRDARRRS